MAELAKLKLVAFMGPQAATPQQLRRNKLLNRLREQIALAQAQAHGLTHFGTRLRPVRNGSRMLELAKAKSGIEIANSEQLVATLETISQAVAAGVNWTRRSQQRVANLKQGADRAKSALDAERERQQRSRATQSLRRAQARMRAVTSS